MASNQQSDSARAPTKAFRLAFVRRKIRELFQNPGLNVVLLTEIREGGKDAELIVRMLDKIQPV